MKRLLLSLLFISTLLFQPWLVAETLRVDAQWLKQNFDPSTMVIVDTRSTADFEISHIPNAVNLHEELTYQDKKSGGLIAPPNVIQDILRERGIDTHKTAIVYDDGNLITAARVFWTLEVYGIKQVRILNGGFADWLSHGFDVSDRPLKPKVSNYVPQVDHRRIASKFSTRLASINPKQSLIDARDTSAYRGETSTAKRFGHIPSAMNIAVHEHFEKQDNDANHLLSLNALAALYKGVPKDEKVVLYCEVGAVSSTNYLVLRELGYDVANYDASWREWGNDLSLPIEK
ncbi:MAG: sulfurtransferase [Gammaproteobacteria bacterium]|nr:sulfurtransferase [Gammaproteobacteria bacterium]